MHSFLTVLPVEVQIMIADELVKSNEVEEDGFLFPCYQDDLMNWSSTSNHFRTLLSPYVFRSLIVNINGKSDKSAEPLLKGSPAIHVKFLMLIGPDYERCLELYRNMVRSGGARGANDNLQDSEVNSVAQGSLSMSSAVEQLLSNLRGFASLKTLSLGIGYPFGPETSLGYLYEQANPLTADPNRPPHGAQGQPLDECLIELRRQWQEMVTEIYTILFRYQDDPPFSTFEDHNFDCDFTIPFGQTKFHKLLHGIKSFGLTTFRSGNKDDHLRNEHSQC